MADLAKIEVIEIGFIHKLVMLTHITKIELTHMIKVANNQQNNYDNRSNQQTHNVNTNDQSRSHQQVVTIIYRNYPKNVITSSKIFNLRPASYIVVKGKIRPLQFIIDSADTLNH